MSSKDSAADDKAQTERDQWEHKQADNSAGVMGRPPGK